MNKQLKLLQRSKVLKTLEVEKVKHDLSKIENSTIVMVAYDDATDKFLIGDNSGDLYVATSEYLKSLDIKNSSIDSIINGMTKSSIAQHFNKISLQEAKEMFGNKYLYYWSANNKIYGVKRGIIERLDNGPDNTSVVQLWDRNENVLSNDRGVTGLKEVKFSSELRPAFLTFDKDALPTYTRDNYLTVRDPVEVADIMNNDIQNHDYVPKDDKYGYDMKDSNAVMKAYLGTDDLIVLSNIDKRKVIDIEPPTVDPDNPDVEYNNNTTFNHNYNMVWSTIRSARLFEEFNGEANDNDSNFVNMTRHERNELTNFTLNNHVDAAGLYANIPNLADTYTTYINGKDFGDKQIYDNGNVAVSIKNDFKWSLDKINGNTCTITRRVYNSVIGEVTNAQKTYDGIVEFETVNVKDNTARIRKTFKIPSLNNTVCDFDKFEYKHDSTGTAISLPVPEEYEDGIVEYKLDTTKFTQGTNGKISYGLREIYIQSGETKYLVDSTKGTGTAAFSVYTLAANSTSATIKRITEIIFKNTDGTNYSYKTINNGIGTGSVEHLVANTPTGVSNNNHISRHTRNVHYISGSTDVVCKTDYSDPIVNYKIYTLNAGSTTATLKGSSTGVFKTIVNGSETSTTYNVAETDHITVTSNTITYTRNAEKYTSASDIKCSQTMNVDYSYGGVTIRKTITKSAAINHSIYNLGANATSATIKRVFTPVFYTISAGVESSSIIYKNDIVTIDTDKTATVSHIASNSVTSASGSNHYATHTRTVTYTQNNVTVTVNTTNVNAVIFYRIYTLSAGSTTATLKGSSTGVFKTIVNGSETSTTYNVSQNDHITVNGNVSLLDIIDSYTVSLKEAYLQLIIHYMFNNVTIHVIKNSDITNIIDTPNNVNEHDNTATFARSYSPTIKCISNGAETATNYFSGNRSLPNVTGTITQTLTVANHANDYNFNTVIKETNGNIIVDTNTMNITERLGNVTLKQAASMLLNNTDNAKNKVYIGDYIELGGYTWQNNSGTTFTAGTAKYTLVERTSDGHLIFMSSERHKLTTESDKALTWEQLITNNKLETILLSQLESILGITPVSYTRKSDIPHLTNKRVFLATEYEIFGKYSYQKENERYPGERQWEAFNFNKEENRKIFRRDVKTGDINNYAPSNSYDGYGYWLATNSSNSGFASDVNNPDYSDFGYASNYRVTIDYYGVRPCFML